MHITSTGPQRLDPGGLSQSFSCNMIGPDSLPAFRVEYPPHNTAQSLSSALQRVKSAPARITSAAAAHSLAAPACYWGNGAHAPLLDVVVTQDLSFEFFANGQGCASGSSALARSGGTCPRSRRPRGGKNPGTISHRRTMQEILPQVSLRSRERFWDIQVPKIDSIFDNSLVPRPSWSACVPPQHRKLVAATHRPPI